MAIDRGLAYAPYADLVWFETATPDLSSAEQNGGSGKLSIGLAQNPQDMGAFGVPERNWLGGRLGLHAHELMQRRIEYGPA